jgi:hypothetical protein
VWVVPPEAPLPEAPEWLVNLYAPAAPTPTRRNTPPTDVARLMAEPCPPGTRHDTALRIAGALARRGLEEDVLAATLESWRLRCCPDHEADDIARIAHDIAAKQAAKQGPRHAARPQRLAVPTDVAAIQAGLAALQDLGRRVAAATSAPYAPNTSADSAPPPPAPPLPAALPAPLPAALPGPPTPPETAPEGPVAEWEAAWGALIQRWFALPTPAQVGRR